MATETSIAEPQQIVELPTPNLPLLRKVLDHIDAHPEEWDQNVVINDCGTAFCVAGHAVLLAGRDLVRDERFGYTLDGNGSAGVCDTAAVDLGLTDDERADLFYTGNSRQRVQDVAESIAARAGERL